MSYIEITVQAPGEPEAADLALKAYQSTDGDLEYDTVLLQGLGVDYHILEERIN
jgi:hypothetical protein